MGLLERLKVDLEILQIERSNLVASGWYLQHCWLVQVQPGGTARTNRSYWQVRSRQAMFDGKKLKHLKAHEVEEYKAAIERGRQLERVDIQIRQIQQQFRKALRQAKRTHQKPEPAKGKLSSQPTRLPATLHPDALQSSTSQSLDTPALTELFPEWSEPQTAESQAVESQTVSQFAHSLSAAASESNFDRFLEVPNQEEFERERMFEELLNKNQKLRSFLQETIAQRRTLVNQNRLLREQRKQTQAVTRMRSAELLSNASTCVIKQYCNQTVWENSTTIR